jgi:hypothetical protein
MAERDVPLTAHDFPREVLDLFDAYVHGCLSRRGFSTSVPPKSGRWWRPQACLPRWHRFLQERR